MLLLQPLNLPRIRSPHILIIRLRPHTPPILRHALLLPYRPEHRFRERGIHACGFEGR